MVEREKKGEEGSDRERGSSEQKGGRRWKKEESLKAGNEDSSTQKKRIS